MRPSLITTTVSDIVRAFFLIVSDEDERDPGRLLDVLQFLLHILAQLQIQCSERLIQQQHLRAGYKRSGYGNTLLLTAGKACDAALCKVGRA